eukprot:2634723-Rhodomonas_salina.4
MATPARCCTVAPLPYTRCRPATFRTPRSQPTPLWPCAFRLDRQSTDLRQARSSRANKCIPFVRGSP